MGRRRRASRYTSTASTCARRGARRKHYRAAGAIKSDVDSLAAKRRVTILIARGSSGPIAKRSASSAFVSTRSG
jgi:hypothetical protein